MSLSNLKQAEGVQEEQDSVGSSFNVESGADVYTIELAYISESEGGAMSLNLHLKSEKAFLRQTLWMTSGREKGQKTYYENKDGKKINLPGFSLANSLTNLTVGKDIADLDTEEKVIKLYSFEEGKEVPTNVNAVTDIMGQKIIAGVIKQIVDKNIKNDEGKYVPSGETREENEIDKFFRADDGLTMTEIKGGVEEATFLNTWKDKWTGKTRNKAKGATSGSGAVDGAPPAPAKSLFD